MRRSRQRQQELRNRRGWYITSLKAVRWFVRGLADIDVVTRQLMADIRTVPEKVMNQVLDKLYWHDDATFIEPILSALKYGGWTEWSPSPRRFWFFCRACEENVPGDFRSWEEGRKWSDDQDGLILCARCWKARENAGYGHHSLTGRLEQWELEVEALKELARTDYHAYLQTSHWRSVAESAKKRAGRRCQLCNSDRSLTAHHRTYERVGCEWDEDLTVLCQPCHEIHHAIMKLRRKKILEG